MKENNRKTRAAGTDYERHRNAVIGPGTLIEPGVEIGWRYHENCGKAHIGKNGILRKGTIIYGDVTIGDYFQTGHYAIVRARVEIGDYCCLLNHSTLEGIVQMGNGVRVMTHTYIPSRTWVGDNVFIGPGVTFLNDRYPGRADEMEIPRGATIEDDVMIGGGSVIMAGITIGERSFIAAGALVHKDVPPRSLVIGVPGELRPLPEKLDRENNRALTQNPYDIWHPDLSYPGEEIWPQDWPK